MGRSRDIGEADSRTEKRHVSNKKRSYGYTTASIRCAETNTWMTYGLFTNLLQLFMNWSKTTSHANVKKNGRYRLHDIHKKDVL